MIYNGSEIDLSIMDDKELLALFNKAAEENGTTANDVISNFIKDYIVSSGHPEWVVNRWPWNERSKD